MDYFPDTEKKCLRWALTMIHPEEYLNILQNYACQMAPDAFEELIFLCGFSRYASQVVIFDKMLQLDVSSKTAGILLNSYLNKPLARFRSLVDFCKFQNAIRGEVVKFFHAI